MKLGSDINIMDKNIAILDENEIKNKIYTIRDKQVMLDSDLAVLYGVEIRALNQAVKRNNDRFPEDFMFQLTAEENEFLRSQIVTLKNGRGQHSKYLPYVFTEQGVSMLSAVLRSPIAIDISVKIIRTFVNMRKFISENAQIFKRLDSLEKYQKINDDKFEKIFNAIEDKEIKQNQGIFFEGEIFDAYVFISEIIKKADKSIIVIDNYIDESVLQIFAKNTKNINIKIFSANITKGLELDIKKYNSQYNRIELKEFKDSHDRFLIIDKEETYHFGASLKDLGKKWFAFSKFDKNIVRILDKL